MDVIHYSKLLGQLNWRYAVKQFDPLRRISPDIWAALEDALVLTPSSGGLQPWAFIVVEDHVIRERLVHASYGQVKVKESSHLVVFAKKCNFSEADVEAHIQRTADVQGRPVESLIPFRDMLVNGIVKGMDKHALDAWAGRQVAIALGSLLTSAALLGIDACPMEGFANSQYDTILGLSAKGLGSVAVCALGYRSEKDEHASLPKVRFPKERVLFQI